MRKMKRSDRQIKWQLDTEVAGSSNVTRIPICIPVPGLTEAFSVLLSHLISYTCGLQAVKTLIPGLL